MYYIIWCTHQQVQYGPCRWRPWSNPWHGQPAPQPGQAHGTWHGDLAWPPQRGFSPRLMWKFNNLKILAGDIELMCTKQKSILSILKNVQNFIYSWDKSFSKTNTLPVEPSVSWRFQKLCLLLMGQGKKWSKSQGK